MAIQLEFLSIIVLAQRIRDLYPSGWSGFLADNAKKMGRTIWYDSELVRAGGVMDSDLIDPLIKRWTRLGFTATEVVDGKGVWSDLVVCDSFGFSKHGDCPWIVINGAERIAYLRGTEPGEVIGRENFSR